MPPDDTYTHGHHRTVLTSHSWRTVENSAGYLKPHLRTGQTILDVGCGPGTITLDLAALVAPGQIVGIDRDEGVLGTAEAERLSRGVVNASFRTGDVYNLDVEDDSFDIVHAHQVLQHLSDPVAALAEMRRVCRPDGWVAARDSDYAGKTWAPADERLDRWLSVYRQMARSNDAEPEAGRYLLGWAQQAGFSVVQPSASVWCFATPEDRAWWGNMWAERVTQSRFAEQAIGQGLATDDEISDIADTWREWVAAEDGWFVVLHGEILCRP